VGGPGIRPDRRPVPARRLLPVVVRPGATEPNRLVVLIPARADVLGIGLDVLGIGLLVAG